MGLSRQSPGGIIHTWRFSIGEGLFCRLASILVLAGKFLGITLKFFDSFKSCRGNSGPGRKYWPWRKGAKMLLVDALVDHRLLVSLLDIWPTSWTIFVHYFHPLNVRSQSYQSLFLMLLISDGGEIHEIESRIEGRQYCDECYLKIEDCRLKKICSR